MLRPISSSVVDSVGQVQGMKTIRVKCWVGNHEVKGFDRRKSTSPFVNVYTTGGRKEKLECEVGFANSPRNCIDTIVNNDVFIHLQIAACMISRK
jgi:hypothetical protein